MMDYTYQDMLKMQEEAAVRVREMKKRAAIAVENDEKISTATEQKALPDEVKRISYPVELPEDALNISSQPQEERTGGILDIIKTDSDSMLILFILILLAQEETDHLTSLALLYLLL